MFNEKNLMCAILVPVTSVLEPETEEALVVLGQRGYRVNLLRGSSQVDLARSSLATEALREGYEETFWIDSDTKFDPDDVDRIRALDLPFCAALYPCKGPKRLAGKLLNTDRVRFGEGGGVVEVEYVGMGFTHVRRRVYEAVSMDGVGFCTGGYGGKTVVPFFLPIVEGDYLSEDYSFCKRAKRSGFNIFVDTRIEVKHIGRYAYGWRDLLPDVRLRSFEVEMQQTGEITLPRYEEYQMGITIENLLKEQQNLEQQAAQKRETMVKADQVKQKACDDLNAVNGALQVVQHLLSKLQAKTEQQQVADGAPMATDQLCAPDTLGL